MLNCDALRYKVGQDDGSWFFTQFRSLTPFSRVRLENGMKIPKYVILTNIIVERDTVKR